MPPIPHHLSQKVVKKCKIAAKEKSLGGTDASLRGVQAAPSLASFPRYAISDGGFFAIIVVWGDGDAKKLD